eukprot:4406714-Prymnesium_polylepis.2
MGLNPPSQCLAEPIKPPDFNPDSARPGCKCEDNILISQSYLYVVLPTGLWVSTAGHTRHAHGTQPSARRTRVTAHGTGDSRPLRSRVSSALGRSHATVHVDGWY